jgi:hypothetical protein
MIPAINKEACEEDATHKAEECVEVGVVGTETPGRSSQLIRLGVRVLEAFAAVCGEDSAEGVE